MILNAPTLAALLAMLRAPTAAPSPDAIAPTRNPIVAGDTVILRWYITGTKVLLSGGRFGKGALVTGRSSITDSPQNTTKYTLDLWYPETSVSAGETKGRLIHAQYSTIVEVVHPESLGLKTYQDSRGWRLLHPKEWKCDKVGLPDPKNNALMYFQEEDDSLERLAVAVLPVTEASCASFMKRIESDLPSHYDDVEVVSRKELSFEEVPAILAVVTGKDHTHFGARTNSIILVFVREGRGYVISSRTAASKFPTRQPLLMKLVKSFAFLPASTPRSTAHGRG